MVTYVHINGEPYKIYNISSITIEKNKDIPDGKIKVLQFTKWFLYLQFS